MTDWTPLTPEAVAQMVADRDAGTPGPWTASPSPFEVYNIGHGVLKNYIVADDYTMIAAMYDDDLDDADTRRIARLPDLEAAYFTLAAENATLRASEAAALEALAEIGMVVAALEGKDSLDREMIRNIETRIAALTPTADKE